MNRANYFDTYGAEGAPLTTEQPSPDQFNAMTGTAPTYSNEHPHSPPFGVKWTNQTLSQHFDWVNFGSLTGDVWVRIYLYLTALPADNNFYPFNFRTNTDTSGGALRILSTGIIQMRDNTNSQIGGDGLVAVATNQLVRLEVRQNTGLGGFEYWLYNTADSTTASDTGSATGAALGTNTDRINFGHNITGVAAGLTSWWDDAGASDVAKLGPAITDTNFIRERTVRGSRRGAW